MSRFNVAVLLFMLTLPAFSQESDTLSVIQNSDTLSSIQNYDSIYQFTESGFLHSDTLPEPDSLQVVEVRKPKSPSRALLYAMVLPGLGQAYNKKYWKIPIIYAGFGTLIYFVNLNDNEYKLYRNAYYHSLLDDGSEPVNEYETLYTTQTLLDYKNYYRRNRDLTYILAAFLYILNIVDATVDAHLFDYEMTDDLSLNVQPTIKKTADYQNTYGLSLRFSF